VGACTSCTEADVAFAAWDAADGWLPARPLAPSASLRPGAEAGVACAQVLEAQMLPATAPFYMGIAAGWAVLVGAYVHHTGARAHIPCRTHLLARTEAVATKTVSVRVLLCWRSGQSASGAE